MDSGYLMIYLFWFLLLYLFPASIFFRVLRITPVMITLEGMTFTPKYNAQQNVMSIDNNFADFLTNNKKLIHTIAVKTLKKMCEDAQQGLKMRPEYYLLRYKSTINNFTGYVFLGSFIPFVLIALDAQTPPQGLLVSQIICMCLIMALYKILAYRYEGFCGMFYRNWYDRILNYDLVALNGVTPSFIQEMYQKYNSDFLSAAREIVTADQTLAGALIESSTAVSEKMTKMAVLQNSHITPESIAKLLDDNLNNVSALNADMKEIVEKTGSSITSQISMSQPEIDVINKNTSALLALKQLFESQENKTQTAEIEHLRKVSDSLLHVIGTSFSSVENAAKENGQKLTDTYDSFFKTCNRFTAALENISDEKTAVALGSLNESFVRIEAVMKSFDESTKQLSAICPITWQKTL